MTQNLGLLKYRGGLIVQRFDRLLQGVESVHQRVVVRANHINRFGWV